MGCVVRRPPPASSLRLLWWAFPHALLWLPQAPPTPQPAALRTLRGADGVAGRAVSRVCGAANRLRVGTLRRRVRRSRARARPRVEGARDPPPLSLCGRPRRRTRQAAGRGRHHVYPAGRDPPARARRASCIDAGAGARRPLGARSRAAPRTEPRGRAADLARLRAAPSESARCLHRATIAAAASAARRRRLHDGLDRERGRNRAETARHADRRGGDVRAGDAPLSLW